MPTDIQHILIFTVVIGSFSLSLAQQVCVPPKLSVHPQDCCMIPSFFDDSDLISCKLNKGTDLATRPNRKKRFATSRIELGTCYLDCVFKVSGINILSGQVLDTNRLIKILVNETPNEIDSITVTTNAVNNCISDLNRGVLKVRNSTLYQCNTLPSTITMCIHSYFFLNCPVSRFVNTLECNQLKEYLARCPVPI